MNNVLSSLAGEGAPYTPAHAQPTSEQLVNLDEVLRNELAARQQQVNALQAIIRFDALPHVQSSQPNMARMLNHIFSSILAYPPAGTKLFIYIKCEKERTEVMDLSLAEGFQRYDVSVFTNIVANESWQHQQQPHVAELKQLVESAKGTFSFFAIEKTGCLYQLVLPGKFI